MFAKRYARARPAVKSAGRHATCIRRGPDGRFRCAAREGKKRGATLAPLAASSAEDDFAAPGIASGNARGESSERHSELRADGARLVHEQARSSRHFRGDGAVVAEIGDLVGEVLADDRELERSVVERDACIEQAIRAPLAR